MRHWDETDLALFSGGDLSLWKKARIGRHLKRCPECRARAEAFSEQRELLEDLSAELPAGVNWGHLAREMKANIQLGVDAGRCVDVEKRPAAWSHGWRPAAVLASVLLMFVSVWWFHARFSGVPSGPEDGVVLEATADGIEIRQQDRVLTMMHADSEPVMLSVNAEGAMAARYIDDDTGMVTINNVYVQ